jgi:hypothetical protein
MQTWGFFFQIGGALAERAIPKGDVLVVVNERAAAKAQVRIAFLGCRCPNAVFLFLEGLVDPLFHFIGNFDQAASSSSGEILFCQMFD